MKPILSFLLVFALIRCTEPSRSSEVEKPLIDTMYMANHIAQLSSDAFMGRKPFTAGEALTVDYLIDAFKNLEIEPGNGESYVQEVPLVEITAIPSEEMVIEGPSGSEIRLRAGEDFVALTQKPVDQTSLQKSELVYAGFGIVAPEYDWDDYAGLDVAGKTVVVLVNDPGFGSGDSTLFKGETMTYYGRWTYKYEEAARQGAAGVLIIHETVPAGYPWLVVRNSWSGATLNLDTEAPLVDVQGWISRDAAIQLFEASDVDMTNYVGRSRSGELGSVSLGLNVSVDIENEIRRDVSSNVIAKITGTERPEETIIYSAHWDHLGVGPAADGDSIYNGAHDNASGTAMLLGLANAYAQKDPPKRTVVFLAVTAEEQGLLGSAYYAQDPVFPPQQTVANLNMDGVSSYGFMKDFTIIGYGQSELEDLAAEIATSQNRYIIPDPDAGKGYFFRSDHFSFAKVGIPALFASGSYDAVDGGIERVERLKQEYLTYKYHKPADEMDEDWRFGGIYQDTELYFKLGWVLANGDSWPKWKEGSEFKAIREGR